MKQPEPPSALEQQLTQILAELPIPIRIVRHHPEGGGLWYMWKALLTGTGDCGSFEEAVRQALTYVITTLQAQGDQAKLRDVLLLRPEVSPYHPHQPVADED